MIYIASDHAGFELKKAIIDHLKEKGEEVEDCGAYSYDKDDDYPDFIYPCALRVAQGKPGDVGIIMGGSGQGEAMVANKVKGIRATEYYGGNMDIVKMSKTHNDANVLSFGARFITAEQATEAVDLWLSTKYEGDARHERRHKKIAKIEQEQ